LDSNSRRKRCIGVLVGSKGVLVRCPKIVPSTRRANGAKYHSQKCYDFTHARRTSGYALGDVYIRYTHARHAKRRREKAGSQCIGWTVDSNNILVRCSESESGSSPYIGYHSLDCYNFTFRRRKLGYALGDPYHQWRRTKRHQELCEGWTIRDGIIAKCAALFTGKTTRQKHHSLACMYKTRRWRKIGYHLRDSVRRTCAYRDCTKGAGGRPGTFDRIKLNKETGVYWCDGRCAAAEERALEAERIAALRAQASEGIRLQEKVETGELISSGQIDKNKIETAARLRLAGLTTPAQMTDYLNPAAPGISALTARERKADRKKRVNSTKQFLRRNLKRIDLAEKRQPTARDASIQLKLAI